LTRLENDSVTTVTLRRHLPAGHVLFLLFTGQLNVISFCLTLSPLFVMYSLSQIHCHLTFMSIKNYILIAHLAIRLRKICVSPNFIFKFKFIKFDWNLLNSVLNFTFRFIQI